MGIMLLARSFFLDSMAAKIIARQVAPYIDGHVKILGTFMNKSIYLRGVYKGFPVQIATELSFGNCKLKMKATQDIPSYYHLTLKRDDMSQKTFKQMQSTMDEWDQDGYLGQNRIYLSDHVWIQASDHPQLLRSLPPELARDIVSVVEHDKHGYFHLWSEELHMTVASSLAWKRKPHEIIMQRLNLATAILNALGIFPLPSF